MKSYCNIKYNKPIDIEQLHIEMKNIQYPAFFSVKNKYTCSLDKNHNSIYMKYNTSRNAFSPSVRISDDSEFFNVTCQYSEVAYIITYVYSLMLLFVIFAILQGEGDVFYKIQVVSFVIFLFWLLPGLLVNKFFFLNECKDIERDLRKIIKSEAVSFVYKWKWYVDLI